jgi:hypothetical protein
MSRPKIALLTLLPAAVLLAALATSTSCARGTRATVRDSSGIAIVENPGSLAAGDRGWSIAAEPDLIIGTAEGDSSYQLYGVAGAHRTADGGIALVDAGSWQVRIYDARGAFLRSFGGRGGGPEEFGMPALGGAVHDTLVVVDRAQHRIAMVHPDVGFVRLARVDDEVGGYLNPAGTFGNGQVVFGGAFDMRRIGELHEGMNRAHTFYRSCNPDGSMAADFGYKIGAEFFIRTLEGSGPDSRPALVPFGKQPLATVSPDRFYFASGDNYEIEVYEPTGRLVRLIRLDRGAVAVTAQDGRVHIEEMAAEAAHENEARVIRQRLAQLPLPETFPAFANLEADALGYLWAEQYRRPGQDEAPWDVFDPEGVLTAQLRLPPRVYPLEIGADYLLALHWDELEIEYVHLYALQRPRRR